MLQAPLGLRLVQFMFQLSRRYFPPTASYWNCVWCDLQGPPSFFLVLFIDTSWKYGPHLASLHASPPLLSSLCCLLDVGVLWGSILHALLPLYESSSFIPIIILFWLEITFPLKDRRNWSQIAFGTMLLQVS